jgi:predicted small lipoprotein YifL
MNTIPRRALTSVASIALLASLAILGGGGPLDPPAGVVAPTAKPLAEIEPRTAINATNTPGDPDSLFKITTAGSYYLTGTITGVAAKYGIEIAATNGGVTLDLNGFDLVGVAGSLDGIRATVAMPNLVVINGSVRSWGGDGVDLSSSLSGRVEGVNARACAGGGIKGGECGLVNCTAVGNGSNGLTSATSFTNCSSADSAGHGFISGDGAMFLNCTARGNAGDGFQATDSCSFTGCTAVSNTGQYGFRVGGGGTFTGCSAGKNTSTQSTSAGFFSTGASTFTSCTAYQQTSTAGPTAFTGVGFIIGTSSTIRDCTASTNRGDGIQGGSRCTILNNIGVESGFGGPGAGIHVTGVLNRIEGNNCQISDRGIDVDGSNNIVIRNSCSNNTTNWTIVANNVIGPIIDRSAPVNAAVSGNSAAGSLGSTDANANYTH